MGDESLIILQKEIAVLEQLLTAKKQELKEAQAADSESGNTSLDASFEMNNQSPPEMKISLFRFLFKGREDIYARRFENSKTGISGYQPVCRNEWLRGICSKPKVKCGNCEQRSFEAVTDEAIRNHLTGFTPAKRRIWKFDSPSHAKSSKGEKPQRIFGS